MGKCQMTPDWDAYYQAGTESQSSFDPAQIFGCATESPSPYGNQAFIQDYIADGGSGQASESADSSQENSSATYGASSAMATAMGPPGNCTQDEWFTLQQVVKQECKVNMPRSCNAGDSQETLDDKAAHFERCISARTNLAETCFDGGDVGHQIQVDNLTNGLNNCEKLRTPVPVPVPAPEREPDTAPVGDPGFMDHMGEITGLTGAALITYILLSEGSRFFPPRNLVPVP